MRGAGSGVPGPPAYLPSVTRSLISSLFPRSSGAYIAATVAGRAENFPGISARRR